MLKKYLSNKKLKLTILFIVFLVGGYGIYTYKIANTKDTVEIPTFNEYSVKKGDITIDFTADGEADIPVVNLDAQISGKLMEVLVTQDQQIKKGDVVATFDDTDYRNKLKSSQIEYEKAVSKLELTKQQYELQLISEKEKLDNLKAQLDKASTEYFPMEELKDIFTQQEIELKRIAYESAKASYESQVARYNVIKNNSKEIEMEKANVEGAKISLQTAQDNLNNTILTAPVDGKILSIAFNPGEVVPENAHLMVLSDAQKVEVNVPVSEIDLSNIALDQNVEIEFEAYEGQLFLGKVTAIDSLPQIDQSGLVTYNVTIELNEAEEKIKIGMTCTVSFILNQRQNVFIIPNKAVSIVDGKQLVQVKDENGNIVSKTIVTGLTDGTNVEVIEGIDMGEIIMVPDKK